MMLDRELPSYFILAIALCALVQLISVNGEDANVDYKKFVDKVKSFSIRTIIKTVNDDGSVSDEHLTELYSSYQRRAKLEYDASKDKKRVIEKYFYDANSGNGVTLQGSHCGSGAVGQIYQYMFPDSPLMHELLARKDENLNLNYVIGPAKLLYLIASHATELEAVVPTYTHTIRNYQASEFRLNLEMPSKKGTAKLSIFYDREEIVTGTLHLSIPLLVSVTFPTQKQAFIFEYFNYQLLDDFASCKPPRLAGSSPGECLAESEGGSEKLIDEFAFPLVFKCARLVGPSDLFQGYDFSTNRLSFTANSVQTVGGSSYKHFVAYDGMTRMLRIDSKRYDLDGSDGRSRISSNVFDLRNNRRYLVNEDTRQCAVTYALPPSKDSTNHMRVRAPGPSRLFLGGEYFAYMGRAKVRGVDALVYESTFAADDLPFWFSEPLVYLNSEGNFAPRPRAFQIREKGNSKSKSREYVFVAYVAEFENEVTGVRLLRLETYDMNMPRSNGSHGYRMTHATQFHNFVWDLSEAPNGDRPLELFSHRDICSSSSSTNDNSTSTTIERYAKIDLLLEQDNSVHAPSSENEFDWIEDNIVRQMTLAASIRDSLDLQIITMYDLQSRVTRAPDERITILASFRVAEHPRVLHTLTFMGNANLNGKPDKRLSLRSTSLADCIWLASGLSRIVYIYFSEVSQNCLADIELNKKGDRSKLNDSKLFKMNPNGLGEVYQIESELDHEVAWTNAWLRDGNFRHLENRMVILQWHSGRSHNLVGDTKELTTRIRRIKLDNFNYARGAPNSQSNGKLAPVMVYQGFGLPDISSHSRLVDLTSSSRLYVDDVKETTGVDKGTGNSQATTVSDRIVPSLQQCQAACLADLNCRSFSYCVRVPKIHCAISTLSFESSKIREQLGARDVQRLRGRTQIKVTLDNDIETELVRDQKCELHNKYYLDMFRGRSEVVSSLLGRVLFSVSSEEQCAEICFAQSLKSIQTSVELSEEINVLLDKMAKSPNSLTNSEEKRLESLRQQRSDGTSKFCERFMYLDSSLNKEQKDLLKSILDSDNEPKGDQPMSNGYCVIDIQQQDQGQPKATNVPFQMKPFEFDFSTLYEKKFGFRLLSSPFDHLEHNARIAVHSNNYTDKQYELLKNSIKEKRNSQIDFSADETDCARRCFRHTDYLWPGCRSFDVTFIHSTFDQSVSKRCYLNSRTLNEVDKNSALVRESRSSSVQMWHYEARFGLASRLVDDAYRLELIARPESQAFSTKIHLQALHGAHFAIFMIVVLGITSGLVAGLLIARRIPLHSKGRSGNVEDIPANTFALSSSLDLDLAQAELN